MQVARQVGFDWIDGVHAKRLKDVAGDVGAQVLTADPLNDLSEKEVVDVRILCPLIGKVSVLSRDSRRACDLIPDGKVGKTVLFVGFPRNLFVRDRKSVV